MFSVHMSCHLHFTLPCLGISNNRVATGHGMVKELLFFFKVREKLGNFAEWSGKYQNSQGKVRELPNIDPKLFGSCRYNCILSILSD